MIRRRQFPVTEAAGHLERAALRGVDLALPHGGTFTGTEPRPEPCA